MYERVLMYEDESRMGSGSVFVVSALCLPELLLEEAFGSSVQRDLC